MDFNLEFSREADIEFNTIDCFFGAIGIGEKFHKDFHMQMMRIQSNPFQFQLRYEDIRIVHLKHFNYSIHFNVKKDNIIVLRILSQHQDY
ncbi:MAG: type II toxin-antitoxin system RelE/ParE family toxin [Aequorivita sp.]